MEMYVPYYWLAVVIMMSIVEFCTAQMVSIWFVIAAVVSLILSLTGAPIIVQTLTFGIVSVVLLVLTRPFVKRFLEVKKTETNSDRYIGMTGIVLETVDNLKSRGQVSVAGSVWTARSVSDDIIEKDSQVKIERIEGVKFIVSKHLNKEDS